MSAANYTDSISQSTGLSISVVTPSFNQAPFLPECLASVECQTYKPIEHLIYDPGSSDGSIEIIKNYTERNDCVKFYNEKDKGQSDAVSKGMVSAKGDIIAWINSDDIYHNKYVFEEVVKRFNQKDEPDLVYGLATYIDNEGKKLRDCFLNKDSDSFRASLQYQVGIIQPSTFIRKDVINKIGVLDLGLEFAMDYEYWIRATIAGLRFGFLEKILSHSRLHPDTKTLSQRGEENLQVFDFLKKHYGYVHFRWIRRYAEFVIEAFDGILTTSANTEIRNQDKLEETITQLLRDYNTSVDALNLLSNRKDEFPYQQTYVEMNKRGLISEKHCHLVSEDEKASWLKRLKSPTCDYQQRFVGGRRFTFKKAWIKDELEKSRKALDQLREERQKDTCIIVGNGPSLRKTDISLLARQDVFASNNIFLNVDILKHIKYYGVANNLVAEQNYWHINALNGIHKFFLWFLSICINSDNNTHFLNSTNDAEFCKDITEKISWKSTVTFFLMQIAYYLGYRKCVLIGFDHYYNQARDLKEGDVIVQDEDDTNHFDPLYFRGKKWHAADVNNMEEVYHLAKQAFEEDGREIVNSTVGGHLEVFRREDLKTAI